MHEKGLRHRGVSIFVFNSKGELLIQKRSAGKDICPGFFAISAAGHLSVGETYDETAKRELEEELGIKVPLEKLGKYWQDVKYPDGKADNEIVMVYKCLWDGDYSIQEEELESASFMLFDKVRRMIKEKAENFMPSLEIMISLFFDDSKAENAGLIWKA